MRCSSSSKSTPKLKPYLAQIPRVSKSNSDTTKSSCIQHIFSQKLQPVGPNVRCFQLRCSCRFPYISAVSAGCSADADAGDAEALACSPMALAEALAGEPVPPSMATHRPCGFLRATDEARSLFLGRKKDCRDNTPRLRRVTLMVT